MCFVSLLNTLLYIPLWISTFCSWAHRKTLKINSHITCLLILEVGGLSSKSYTRTCQKAQCIKCLPHKPDDQSLIPRTQNGRRELIPKSCPLTTTCTPVLTHTHTIHMHLYTYMHTHHVPTHHAHMHHTCTCTHMYTYILWVHTQ